MVLWQHKVVLDLEVEEALEQHSHEQIQQNVGPQQEKLVKQKKRYYRVAAVSDRRRVAWDQLCLGIWGAKRKFDGTVAHGRLPILARNHADEEHDNLRHSVEIVAAVDAVALAHAAEILHAENRGEENKERQEKHWRENRRNRRHQRADHIAEAAGASDKADCAE